MDLVTHTNKFMHIHTPVNDKRLNLYGDWGAWHTRVQQSAVWV